MWFLHCLFADHVLLYFVVTRVSTFALIVYLFTFVDRTRLPFLLSEFVEGKISDRDLSSNDFYLPIVDDRFDGSGSMGSKLVIHKIRRRMRRNHSLQSEFMIHMMIEGAKCFAFLACLYTDGALHIFPYKLSFMVHFSHSIDVCYSMVVTN